MCSSKLCMVCCAHKLKHEASLSTSSASAPLATVAQLTHTILTVWWARSNSNALHPMHLFIHVIVKNDIQLGLNVDGWLGQGMAALPDGVSQQLTSADQLTSRSKLISIHASMT